MNGGTTFDAPPPGRPPATSDGLEDAPLYLRWITLTGSFEGLQNKVFMGLWVTLVVVYAWAFIGWFLMMVGHGLVPGYELNYSDVTNSSTSSYMKISDKGERLALAGWMIFHCMWPPLFLIAGALFKIPELLDVGILSVVLTMVGLAVGCEQVDRATYVARNGTGQSTSTKDDSINGRNLYLAGVVFVEIAYAIWFIAGVLLERLVNLLKLSTIYSTEMMYQDNYAGNAAGTGGAGMHDPYSVDPYARPVSSVISSHVTSVAKTASQRSFNQRTSTNTMSMAESSAFCTTCGVQWEFGDKYCRGCSAPAPPGF